ncbi:CBS domain-containing protein [Paenibacillus mucilaginosus 3016]|uniref:CBS domain-containing protein n=1 Tax=Paenibacillus mucilaginosus 3016 TaxID=1116391 RepID=H6NK32_9BACL|nr:CBS domain-containing protein [Paenibacillus mucilaginosus]AFC30885.1 CBS domain-containing protein [Paenibacillus mucilaginosus 3016]WFA19486.1 CBS domain-containing protein [Paenibacillus mucilaginosus]
MMKAHDIMIRNVYCVNETDSVRSVIRMFLEHRISGVPVVNGRKKIVGYISDGDIMEYIGRHEDRVVGSLFFTFVFRGDEFGFDERISRILDLPVMDIATKKVITVQAEEPMENVAAILAQRQIKKLPVEQHGELVGIISRGDVIRHSFKALL